ncbi:hypothetical protein [Kribbella sp. C-35]|uniref:hypothetical protein n=1 Tax=Kribbella sp. C-35 TaxID=2789276 RepID=UPI003979661B
MSAATARLLAWTLGGLALVLTAVSIALAVAGGTMGSGWVSLTLIAFGPLALASAGTGAVVASRLPRNAVGWILLGLGVWPGLVLGLVVYTQPSVSGEHEPYPGDDYAGWILSWITIPAIFGLSVFLLLLFPDGHLPSRRWRPVAWFMGAALALATVPAALSPVDIPGLRNPVMPAGRAADVAQRLNDLGGLIALPVLGCAATALILRLRRSRGVERQQLKWFTYSAALAGVVLGLSPLTPDEVFYVGLLTLAALPITAGLAILRYRLYDIDVVINKTLVYGALTATLAAAYLGSVLLLQLVVRPITQGSGLAVAVSTLAVAGLFRPVRSRIQSLVDRRFFRRRYDAARTLEVFGARLRDELDVDALGTDLQAVVRDTMQPAHVSLWLRSPR